MSGPEQWALSDGFSARPAVVGFCLNILCFSYGVFCLVWFVRRRKFFPVDQRFSLMMCCCLSLLVQIFWSNLPFPSLPCALSTSFIFITTQVSVICYVLRILDLLFKMNIARGLTFDGGDEEDTGRHTNWCIRHRKLTSRRYQLRFVISYTALCIFAVVLSFVRDPFFSQPIWCPTVPLLQRINVWFMAMWFLVFLVMGALLRGSTNDALYFKQELRLTCILGLLCMFPFMVVGVMTQDSAPYEFVSLARFPLSSLVLTVGLLYPIRLSYRHQSLLKAAKRRGSLSPDQRSQLLSKLLVSSEFTVFLDFLKSEFSAENGMFLKAYLTMRGDERKGVEDYRRLAQYYILPNAVAEVNIPHELRLPIMKLLGNTSKISRASDSRVEPIPGSSVLLHKLLSAFDAVRDEVFRSVARDSLPRFLSTEQGFKIRVNLVPSSNRSKAPSVSAPTGRALRGLILHSSDDSSRSSTDSISNSASGEKPSSISMAVITPGHHVLPSFDSTNSVIAPVHPTAGLGHHSCPSFDSPGHSVVSDGSGPEGWDSPRSSVDQGRLPLDRVPSEKTLAEF